METKEIIEKYQCYGCGGEGYAKCYNNTSMRDFACSDFVSITYVYPGGKIFLGLPKGFKRLGPYSTMKINIFIKFSDGWKYNKYNIPVWKYRDKNNNTIIRGISPRINMPFIHIFIEDCLDKIECIEITDKDIEGMD